jgi:hypothetical protein
MPKRVLPLLLTLVLAAVPRAFWYASHQPEVPPDGFGYLNVAREWRGDPAPPGEWDEQPMLPADNLATRTPGYPLFLDLVFAASAHSRTPEAALTDLRRQLVPGDPARERHLRHLETDENVRAVQVVQHGLAVAATGLVFLTLVRWSGSRLAATVGSLVAIGWSPVWIAMFEPALLTETLAGVVLITTIWLVSRPPSPATDAAASVLCGAAIVIRPAMLFSSLPILGYLVWRGRRDTASLLRMAVPAAAIVALLVVNNGVRYRYWGVTSLSGATLLSHAMFHPDALRDPVKRRAVKYYGNVFGGQPLQYLIFLEDSMPYLEVASQIRDAAIGFIVDHPVLYLRSVADAMREFCGPTVRLFPGDMNVVRTRAPLVWRGVVALETLLVITGMAALIIRLPSSVKLGPLIFLVSALGTSLLAHTENRRFAVPVVPVELMSGVAVVARALPRRSARTVEPL